VWFLKEKKTITQHEEWTSGNGYWKGRVDSHLENSDMRLTNIENSIAQMLQDFNKRLDHIHECFEKRSKILYAMSGGLAVLYIIMQIFSKFLYIKP